MVPRLVTGLVPSVRSGSWRQGGDTNAFGVVGYTTLVYLWDTGLSGHSRFVGLVPLSDAGLRVGSPLPVSGQGLYGLV